VCVLALHGHDLGFHGVGWVGALGFVQMQECHLPELGKPFSCSATCLGKFLVPALTYRQ